MTVEEKLQHFNELCIANANQKAQKLISEYENALINAFEEHKKDEYRRLEMRLSIEKDKLKKASNKELSIENVKLKKMIGDKRDELREKIFVSLEEQLNEFMNTKEYYNMLDRQIKKALDFAKEDEIKIYLDAKDEKLIEELSNTNNVQIQKSKEDFVGGMRAVLPQKHILIDNSFKTKLEEARHSFHIYIGGNDNE